MNHGLAVGLFLFFFLLIILLVFSLSYYGGCGSKKSSRSDCGESGCPVPKKSKCCNKLLDPVQLNVHIGPAEVVQEIPLSSAASVQYGTVSKNVGGWTFDATKALFTVPATGTYFFEWTVNATTVAQGALDFGVELIVDGTPLAFGSAFANTADVFTNTGSGGDQSLQKGQVVELRVTNNSGTDAVGIYQSTLTINRISVP